MNLKFTQWNRKSLRKCWKSPGCDWETHQWTGGCKNYNVLEYKIVNLERQISKAGQYGTSNNVLISGISNKILDQDLEEKVIQICNNSDMAETPMNIEGYQRLRLGRKVTKACQ